MGKQITFFKRNKADYINTAVVVTASQGNTFAPFVQRRSNFTGWATTGSVDSDNTTLTCDFVDIQTLTEIILVNHNFASFNIKYWDGAAYQDFSPAISQSSNTDTTTRLSFASQSTTKIRLTVLGTQVADSDKKLSQLITTELLGTLNGWPIIQTPTFNKNKRISKMLSGKVNIGVNVGGFSCTLSVANWKDDTDLTLVETLYNSGDGFLVWLGGGDEAQFSSERLGYRIEDFFLMKPPTDYVPEWVDGFYRTGMAITLDLVEVTN